MTIQLRHGTASQWTSANPILLVGEAGYETDTGNLKVGDGSTHWASLPYFAGSLSDLVGDTSPQLGGNLDLNGHTVGSATSADLTELHNAGTLSGNNTGDQDLSGYATTSALTSGLNTKQASLGFTPENVANKGVANGYASLDSAGKVPAAQMLSSVVEYKGVWDAATNTPTLIDGTGNLGDEYRVSNGGTRNLGSGSIVYSVGDFVIYNGTIWQRSGGSGSSDVVVDTTPQLGGDLDLNGHLVGAANAADLTKLHNTGTLSGNNTGDKTLSNETTPTLGGNLVLGAYTVGAATAADLTKLHGAGTLTGNNTGDQDLSGYATTSGTRVAPITSSATPSINVDLCDQADITSLVHNITGFTFTGTWKHGQTLMIVLKSASAQNVSGGTSVLNGPAAMPTATVAGKYHEILLKYNSGVGKPVVMAADPTGYALGGSPPPPSGTLLVPSNWSARGANLAFNFNYGPGAAECGQWVSFSSSYPNWIQPQIDDAAANGVNCLRIWGTPEAVCDGHMTLSAYLANWDTVINYCNTKGIRVYPTGGDFARWSSAGDTAVISLFDSWAAMLATHSNVIGVDLCNEAWSKCTDGTTTESAALALLGQLKTKVNSHGLPASSSNGVTYQGGGWTLDTYGGASKWKFYNISDFIDVHLYYPWPYQRPSGTPNGDYMSDMYASSTLGPQVSGKQVFFGEYGTLPTGTWFSTIYPGMKTLIEAGGSNHLGGCAWAMWDYSSASDFAWGLYAVSGFPTGPTFTRSARATLAQNNTIRVTR